MLDATLARECRRVVRGLLASAMALAAMAANAAIVQYSTTALGGGLWRYTYTLDAATSTTAFDGLTIYFEASSFAQIANAASPPGWDALVIQPDTGISADGFLDLLHLGGLLDSTAAPVQFAVDVEYLGTGSPASQRFDLYQSAPFQVVASGQTVQPNGVPEPVSSALAMLALGGALLSRRRTGGRAHVQF